ncbi:MAG: thrombospondin type 3 repeat-containing protein [Patescibacteria group bacterium]|mgnify:CR=1 FL=1
MPENNLNNGSAQIPESNIEVIPSEFYGGMKRQVQTRVERVFVNPTALPATAGTPTQPVPTVSVGSVGVTNNVAPIAGSPLAPHRATAAKLQQPKFIILIVSIFLVIGVAGFAFYYIRQAQQAKAPPLPPAGGTPTGTPTVPSGDASGSVGATPAIPPPPVVPVSTPEVVAPTPSSVILPLKNYTTSLDSDNDGLTDEEEKLFGADLQKPDTDEDGYPDNTELTNLYNPLGFKPEKLIDSGLVKNYFNPTRQYSVYYPAKWVAQALDTNNDEVMFSSDTGEFAEVTLTDNPQKLPIKDWYLSQSPGARVEDLTSIKTKEGVDGVFSPDGLTAYIPFGETIYVINYNIGLKTEINFLSAFKMMVNSFKTFGSQEIGAPVAPPPMETTTTP